MRPDHHAPLRELSDDEIDALWFPDNIDLPQRIVRLHIARAVLSAANKKRGEA